MKVSAAAVGEDVPRMQIAGESRSVTRADTVPNWLNIGTFDLVHALKNTVRAPAFELAIFSLLAVHIGLFLYFGYASRVLRPYSDMFDLIDFYFRFQENGNWLHYLLKPHNYHRLIWLRLLLALDISAFKGSGLPFLAVAFLCHAGVAWLLVREIRWMPLRGVRLPAIALTLMLLLSTAVVVDLSVPANTPYVHTLFFAVLALVLSEPLAGAAREPFGLRRGLALLCVCAAAFSNAVGLVLWPVLAFGAWRGGRSERVWLGIVLACGAAFSASYLYGQPSAESDAPLTVMSLIKSAEYFFAFLGLPWARASGVVGGLIGAGFFACAIAALVRFGGPQASRPQRLALGLILFSLGSAALAALGRRDIAEAVAVPGRYSLLMTPLKLGLFILCLPWLERQWRSHRRLVEGAVVLVLAVLLLKQVAIGRVVAQAGEHLRATISQFHEGRRTPEMTLLIHPDLRRAQSLCTQMWRRGLYMQPYMATSGCAAPDVAVAAVAKPL